MELGVEADTKTRLEDEEVLYYFASVRYHDGEILEDFPRQVDYQRASLVYEDGE